MDNLGFLFAANAVVWSGIIYYVYTIKQRSRALEKDLELLKEALSRKG
jgi:CcmD family protein